MSPLEDVWEFDLTLNRWQELHPAGSGPGGRATHAAVFDAAANRMIVYGGFSSMAFSTETWALEFTTGPEGIWQQLSPPHLPAVPYPPYQPYRDLLTSVLDTTRHEMVLLGGFPVGPTVTPGEVIWPVNPMLVSALDLTQWAEDWHEIPAIAGVPPVQCAGIALVHDQVFDRYVTAGGWEHHGIPSGIWEFRVGGGGGTWQPLSPCGAEAHDRSDTPFAHDTARNRAVQFSGLRAGVASSGSSWPEAEGVRALDLDLAATRWLAVQTSGGPPDARFCHTFVYDPVGDRVILFAGVPTATQGFVPVNDTWELRF